MCKLFIIDKQNKCRRFCRRLSCIINFQSSAFDQDKHNKRNKERTDSLYRYGRVMELLQEKDVIGAEEAVAILRDRKGTGGAELGMGNPKAINQLVAHHSVVFSPADLKMWVSTSPWQSGEFLCYDLGEVFSSSGTSKTGKASREFNIPGEEAFTDSICSKILLYRSMVRDIKEALDEEEEMDESALDTFVGLNPDYYETYDLLGDYRLAEEWLDLSDKESELPLSPALRKRISEKK